MIEVIVQAPPVVEVQTQADPVIVEIVTAGPQGPPGTPGASVASYTHTQASASSTWTINHNLGVRPVVTLLTTGGMEMVGDVTHINTNQAIASFASPVAGTARCV